MAVACAVRPIRIMRLAPMRSATRPQRILPPREPTPATPNTVAAVMALTPWSMALLTMWKMGPECAAQQKKCVKATGELGRAEGLGRRQLGARRKARPRGRRPGEPRGVAHEERGGNDHEPGDVAHDDHRH